MQHEKNSIPWWKKAVIYQIYPRSFQDSNGDGIGDIQGILSRLPYLNDGTPESLGIDAIWISPFYPSPMVDFGYDIRDYKNIDPMFGDLEGFRKLLHGAHQRGIKVILDLVINHTSDQHPWFLEARSSRQNPYRDWYIWHPGKKGSPPNNWFAGFELKSAWWWDEKTGEFYLGTFTRNQPEVNWRNPDLRAAMFDVVRFWLDLGVDGYRMDVVNWYIKDDLWRDNPWSLRLNPPDLQKHIYDRNRPETHAICKEIRAIVDGYEDRFLVGEIFTDEAQLAASYCESEEELHLAFNFSFLFQKWDPRAFHEKIEESERLLPRPAWPNYTLSNHDQPRHLYRYRKGSETMARARVAAAMLLTLRGTPFLYYGEEIGMINGKIRRKERQDPLGIKGWPFLGRDGERTPMQWDASPQAGFTSGQPWLPVSPDYASKNVQEQSCDPDSLLSFYCKLIWLRKETPALHAGEYRAIVENPKNFLAYKRMFDGQEIWVILHFFPNPISLDLAFASPKGTMRVLFSSHRAPGGKVDLKNFRLEGYEVLLLE